MAREKIAEREKAEEVPASDPQLHLGDAIRERLPGWLERWQDHGPVPFQSGR